MSTNPFEALNTKKKADKTPAKKPAIKENKPSGKESDKPETGKGEQGKTDDTDVTVEPQSEAVETEKKPADNAHESEPDTLENGGASKGRNAGTNVDVKSLDKALSAFNELSKDTAIPDAIDAINTAVEEIDRHIQALNAIKTDATHKLDTYNQLVELLGK